MCKKLILILIILSVLISFICCIFATIEMDVRNSEHIYFRYEDNGYIFDYALNLNDSCLAVKTYYGIPIDNIDNPPLYEKEFYLTVEDKDNLSEFLLTMRGCMDISFGHAALPYVNGGIWYSDKLWFYSMKDKKMPLLKELCDELYEKYN